MHDPLSPEAPTAVRKPESPRTPRPFTAVWGTGVLVSIILTLPMSVVIFFIFLLVYATAQNFQVAVAVFLGLLFAWLVFVLMHFAVMRIEIEDTGMVVRSRFMKKDRTPWTSLRIRHLFGPFFTMGNPPSLLTSFLALLVVGRPRAFHLELSRHGGLAP